GQRGSVSEWKSGRALVQRAFAFTSQLKEFSDVIEQPAITRRIASSLLVEAGTTTVEERDEIASLAESGTRVLIPTGMALDAVNADHVGARRGCGLGGRSIAAIVAAIAVAGRE